MNNIEDSANQHPIPPLIKTTRTITHNDAPQSTYVQTGVNRVSRDLLAATNQATLSNRVSPPQSLSLNHLSPEREADTASSFSFASSYSSSRASVDNYSIIDAVESGNLNQVEFYLGRGHDPSINNNSAIIKAAELGHIDVVETLLNHPRVNPADQNNAALRKAFRNHKLSTVKVLLNHPKVNPAVNDNEILVYSAIYGYGEIVFLLLKDDRVNPGARNNLAICGAASKGHGHVVQLLLEHPQVNPFVNYQEPFRRARAQNHEHIAELIENKFIMENKLKKIWKRPR